VSDTENQGDQSEEKKKYAPQPFRTGLQSKWGMFGSGDDQGMAAPQQPAGTKKKKEPTQTFYDAKALRSGIYLNNIASVRQVQRACDSISSSFRWPFSRQVKEKAARLVWTAIHRPGKDATDKLMKARRHAKLGPLLKKWGIFEPQGNDYGIDEIGLHTFASAVKITRDSGGLKVLINDPFVEPGARDSSLLRKVTEVVKMSRENVHENKQLAVG